MNNLGVGNRVIIMCGISGSGKTHYALQLERAGYLRLSTDTIIWDKIDGNIENLSEEDKKRLFAECREDVRIKLCSLIDKEEKIVVDGTYCKRSARDEIRKLCENKGVRPLFIYCFADKDKLRCRLSRREGSGPDDMIVTEVELDNYWNGFERPDLDETDVLFCKTD